MNAAFRIAIASLLPFAALLSPSPADAQSAASAYTSAMRYDADRRPTGTIAPDPDGSGPIHYAATRTTYDTAGHPVSVEKGELSSWQSESVAPASWSGFTVFSRVDTVYDAMDRKATETVSSGGTAYSLTQYSYDAFGRLSCMAVRMNPAAYGSLPSSACTLGTAGSQGPDRITRNVYDVAGQVLAVQKAVGTTLEQNYATYAYNSNGKVTGMVDAGGNKAQMGFDGFDRQIQWMFPDPATKGAVNASDYEAYTYDANGNRTSLRKRDGQTINYSYDALNRVTVKDGPGGTAADVYYDYDLRGLQTYARFGSATGNGLTNIYDGFGRQLIASSNLDGTARALSYQYNADGDRTRVTHPDGMYFVTNYDGLDRPLAVLENGSTQVASWSYNAQVQLASDTRASVTTNYAYDPVSRLSSLGHDLAGTSSDVTWGLTYNPANQIATQIRTNDGYAFSGYVANSSSYTANGLNQYTAVGAGSLGYDANGNLTTTGGTTFGYDVENRLVSATGTLSATLEYDPAGRLWRMTSGATVVSFLYDGDQLTQERDGAGTLLRRYVHGAGEDDPLLWYEGASLTDLRSLQADHQGSIVSIADASGTIRTVNSYDEYGVPASTNDGRFQYTGQVYLPALGFYYYKARMYSSRLGRFMQTDPIGYKDQNNLYAYVGNDPVDGTDPTGMATETATGTHIDGAGSMWTDATEINPNGGETNNSAPGATRPAPGVGGNRSTPPAPDPAAGGNPHTVIQTPGPEGRYTTYDQHGPLKQYRGEPTGKSHGRVPRPNVKDWARNTAPNGKTYAGGATVRSAEPGDIPGGKALPVAAVPAASEGALATFIRFSPLGLLLLLSGDTPQKPHH